jgi:GH24 family phage-related lysozyme (muramidase)
MHGIIQTATKRIQRIKASMSTISEDCVEFVAYFEGFPNDGKPYNDPVGHCTIGFGHLIHLGNCNAFDHQKWGQLTEKEAKQLLRQDLQEFAKGVQKLTTLWPQLDQHERDALISFAFNVGLGAYGDSTLLKKLNRGDKRGAADEFPRWVYASGQKLPGLVRRREAERKMFLGI